MRKKLITYSAYHGKKWKRRSENKKAFFHSEYAPLKEVLLHVPGKELKKIKNPDLVQHLEKIDSVKIRSEFKKIRNCFKKQNIKVQLINSRLFKEALPPNLMFVRDLFWMGPNGAIVSRMGSVVRAPEEKYIAATLSVLNETIALSVNGNALFEGADLLWLNSKTLLIGIGNRTNLMGLKQIELSLFPHKIKLIPIKLPKKVQHLLGVVQFVDRKKVLLRHKIAPRKLITLLNKEQFSIIRIPETDEVTQLQGMNIVTIRPSEIFMADDCPNLKKIYEKNGIKILAEINIKEIRKAAGGLACLCGIISRKNHE